MLQLGLNQIGESCCPDIVSPLALDIRINFRQAHFSKFGSGFHYGVLALSDISFKPFAANPMIPQRQMNQPFKPFGSSLTFTFHIVFYANLMRRVCLCWFFPSRFVRCKSNLTERVIVTDGHYVNTYLSLLLHVFILTSLIVESMRDGIVLLILEPSSLQGMGRPYCFLN